MSAAADVGWRYPAALVAVAAATLLAFVGLLAALDRTGHLPPPALANNICVDEKLAFLRRRLPEAPPPDVLVVGSSVAWRHFDGEALVRRDPDARPLNGGFCGSPMHQAGFAADWFLGRFPSVREVVLIAGLHDFEDCANAPAALFDPADVDAFLAERGFSPRFYLRYFDPFSLARNVPKIAAQRDGGDLRYPLVFDRFGDGPLDPGPPDDGLRYDKPKRFDVACFEELRRLAGRLASEQRRMVVAITPMHPDWTRNFDPLGQLSAEFAARLRDATAGTSAILWDGQSNTSFNAAAFSDAIHLRWAAARCFSELLVRGAIRPDDGGHSATVCPATLLAGGA